MKVRTSAAAVFLYGLLALVALVYLYPLFWLALNSLKSSSGIYADPWGLSGTLSLDNYAKAFGPGRILTYFGNSALICSLTLAFVVVLSTPAAYAIARMKWRLSKAVMALFLVGIMVPAHATLIPLFMGFAATGLLGTAAALLLPYVAFALPTSIFILSGFFASVPSELEEAAVLDGAGLVRTFLLIVAPLTTAAIATISIFAFLSSWNELLFAVVFLSDPATMTLPVGLLTFKGQYMTDWGALLAAIVVSIVPSLVVYGLLSDRIISGMTAGAVKG